MLYSQGIMCLSSINIPDLSYKWSILFFVGMSEMLVYHQTLKNKTVNTVSELKSMVAVL